MKFSFQKNFTFQNLDEKFPVFNDNEEFRACVDRFLIICIQLILCKVLNDQNSLYAETWGIFKPLLCPFSLYFPHSTPFVGLFFLFKTIKSGFNQTQGQNFEKEIYWLSQATRLTTTRVHTNIFSA